MTNWREMTIEEVFLKLKTGSGGLDSAAASRRLKKFGPNTLAEPKTDSLASIFFSQFKSPLIYILFAAAGAVFAMGETVDGFVILFVLLFNALLGSFQEGRAQNALLALKKLSQTSALARRGGREIIIDARELVPGDIIILKEGEKVPADARIIISNDLTLSEAALTGESVPVHKIDKPAKKDGGEESANMVFKGTYITGGSGEAAVTATGEQSKLGMISRELESIDTEIPLQADVRNLSRMVVAAVAIVCFFLLFSGMALGKPAKEMFAVVVSLSISIIPEGLPIVMTLVLAAGVRRMSRRNALVKKLQAVEALGQARVIAVDKTGTITKNELATSVIYAGGKYFEVTGSGFDPKGEVIFEGKKADAAEFFELALIKTAAAQCSNSHAALLPDGEWKIYGDPTEAAMSVLAGKIGGENAAGEKIADFPFSYKLGYHAALYDIEGRKMVALAGAPEAIIDASKKIWRGKEAFPLTDDKKNEFEKIISTMSGKGLRIVALAAGEAGDFFKKRKVKELALIGFLGMRDALRPEARPAIEAAEKAGLKIVMITGDHKATAAAIAKDAGIWHEGDAIVSGREIEAMGEEELARRLDKISVFARVSPEHKMRIIKAYKRKGEIIAMTGDGVNDAPSLVAADLGIAMGGIGTEVAKEAADIVLLDDNFNSITAAIEEGRNIYKTIKKVILYLFSTSVGEVLTITAALFWGMPLPILAAQIIWLNLVTDGFLDVALAMEEKEKGLLSENFKKSDKYLIDRTMAWRMIIMSVPMMIGTLFLFNLNIGGDIDRARTMALTTLAVFQWLNAWNCRSEKRSIFAANPFSNKYLVGATVIVVLLQMLAIYNPFFQEVLKTVPITASDWLLIAAVSSSIVIVEEMRKAVSRRLK